MSVYRDLGVRAVVNAAGTLTRLGGSRMAPEVLAAMAEAARSFVRLEDLQEAAGRVIAQVTGAEAGYVTSGAAAGLLLGTAACVAGLDPERMRRLPELSLPGTKREVVVHRVHRNSYDHALRTVGIRFVEIGHEGHPTPGPTRPYELERVLGAQTALVFWPVLGDPDQATAQGVLPLPEVTRLAHAQGVPVLVDAAAALPPPAHLRRFIAEGADLVVFSGGKAIGGPQASGILAGRADLIRSVALQHQDMDVHPATWTWRPLLERGELLGPPGQGIGRPCKVGREEIVGLVVALQRYVARDHVADQRRWYQRAERLVAGLDGLGGLTVVLDPGGSRGVALVHVQFEGPRAAEQAIAVVNALAEGDPIIAVIEDQVDRGVLGLNPVCLAEDEVDLVIARLRQVIR